MELSAEQEKRALLEKIVELEGEVTDTKSDNSELSSQMDNYSKVIWSRNSITRTYRSRFGAPTLCMIMTSPSGFLIVDNGGNFWFWGRFPPGQARLVCRAISPGRRVSHTETICNWQIVLCKSLDVSCLLLLLFRYYILLLIYFCFQIIRLEEVIRDIILNSDHKHVQTINKIMDERLSGTKRKVGFY